MKGERILSWARRWLDPQDAERVVAPAVADWQHEGRGGRHVLKAIVATMMSERWALARATPWWILAFPILVAVLGTLTLGDGYALRQALWMVAGVFAFALAATTPARWLTSTWAWAAVAGLGLMLLVGHSFSGATRWVALGPLQVEITILALPLLLHGGWRPAAIASVMLAAAPDALAGGALAIAVPHPTTIVAALVALLREPAMVEHTTASWIALASLAAVTLVAARWWRLAEGRLVLALIALGLVTYGLGHGPVPLASYGGSMIVAICMAFGFAVARSGGWTSELRAR